MNYSIPLVDSTSMCTQIKTRAVGREQLLFVLFQEEIEHKRTKTL